MSIEERSMLCKSAKICIKCNNPSYVFQFADFNSNNKHKCVSRNTKSRYNCQNPTCNVHIWCCQAHQPENEEILKNFHREIKSKFNLEFCFNVKQILLPEHSIPTDLAIAKKLMDKVDPPVLQIPKDGRKKNLSSSQAFNKMKIKLKKQGINQELRPIPNGSPQFITT